MHIKLHSWVENKKLKHYEKKTINQQQNVTSQKTRIFNSTAVSTSNLATYLLLELSSQLFSSLNEVNESYLFRIDVGQRIQPFLFNQPNL